MTMTQNPHPAMVGLETVTCVGCGHQVGIMDDIAAIEDPGDDMELICWHVDCGPGRYREWAERLGAWADGSRDM